ncbi:hypothetical protein HYC85_022593 [Camellia sinensis]|uniref:DUF659 domain-containing protein n=1 Tax=Camellia sinensis TaxID=4442 RepID=A0A7J7GG09_CAMSI|nr:hypothetical protein HYC85_022593 [Camellia sinensis]
MMRKKIENVKKECGVSSSLKNSKVTHRHVLKEKDSLTLCLIGRFGNKFGKEKRKDSRGAMFLYAKDYFGVENSGINIAELLLETIDKVGPSNAIQVVTNNAVNCKLAGKEVEKELMKSGDEHTRDVGALITRYTGSDYFWDEVYNIVAITKPIYKLIRFCDKDSPLMGEIYEGMDNMLREIKDILKNNKYSDAYTQIEAIVLGTWEKMNVSMNCLGFALSPQFYDSTYVSTHAPSGTIRKRPNEDKEVVVGVLKAFEKIASHLEEARMLRKQFMDFHMQKGFFFYNCCLFRCFYYECYRWWATYGSETPELAEVIQKVLSQPITKIRQMGKRNDGKAHQIGRGDGRDLEEESP